MTKVPDTPIPFDALSGEDIGAHPGGVNPPELEFEVERSDPPIGTTDPSPTTPEFAGFGDDTFVTSTMWDDQAAIAVANSMPLLAVLTEDGTISVLGSNVDISTLSSNEGFRAINVDTGDVFTSDRATVAEAIEQGYFTPPTKPAAASDEDIGRHPGGGNPPELEFTVDQTNFAAGTFDISLTTPQFAGTQAVDITPATIWDTGPLENFFTGEGGAFGPSAVETTQPRGFDTIKSTVPPVLAPSAFQGIVATAVPAWSGGDNWWDEG